MTKGYEVISLLDSFEYDSILNRCEKRKTELNKSLKSINK